MKKCLHWIWFSSARTRCINSMVVIVIQFENGVRIISVVNTACACFTTIRKEFDSISEITWLTILYLPDWLVFSTFPTCIIPTSIFTICKTINQQHFCATFSVNEFYSMLWSNKTRILNKNGEKINKMDWLVFKIIQTKLIHITHACEL